MSQKFGLIDIVKWQKYIKNIKMYTITFIVDIIKRKASRRGLCC
jgi:hypothetical protein